MATGHVDPEYADWIEVTRNVLRALDETWELEKSFASPLGYGGKVDLHSPGVVIDFKTKDGALADVGCYDEHYMQTAAYARGLGLIDAMTGIVFIRRDEPEARMIMHTSEHTVRGWQMFEALLAYWKAANRYDPA